MNFLEEERIKYIKSLAEVLAHEANGVMVEGTLRLTGRQIAVDGASKDITIRLERDKVLSNVQDKLNAALKEVDKTDVCKTIDLLNLQIKELNNFRDQSVFSGFHNKYKTEAVYNEILNGQIGVLEGCKAMLTQRHEIAMDLIQKNKQPIVFSNFSLRNNQRRYRDVWRANRVGFVI